MVLKLFAYTARRMPPLDTTMVSEQLHYTITHTYKSLKTEKEIL